MHIHEASSAICETLGCDNCHSASVLTSNKEIFALLYELKVMAMTSSPGMKVVNDPIHGHIELHPLAVKIIDTPQFQRLRFIHQLGAGYYVFPGATHKRFDHSIGVYHLAGELVKTLSTQQPKLKITEEDILCVQIAGLCHDLGHGPFSHVFDGKFMKKVRPEENYQHELSSLKMLDRLIEENNLEEKFGDKKNIAFIKALIHSDPEDTDRDFHKTGRDKDKIFLYEIVANKRNGIDVDKWDYFARDSYNVGVTNNFDHKRLMKFARVLPVKHTDEKGGVREELQICWRDKEAANLYDMFYTRSVLHRRVYQHKTTWAIETIISEALVAANEHIRLPKQTGGSCMMSEAVDDMSAFQSLTDYVFNQILYSTDDDLSDAREILKRVEKRDLYKMIGVVGDGELNDEEKDKIPDELVALQERGKLQASDIAMQTFTLDYGMKGGNPIDDVWFYRKENLNEATKLKPYEVPMKPAKFREESVRIFSKKTDKESVDALTKCYKAWCEQKLEKNEETARVGD